MPQTPPQVSAPSHPPQKPSARLSISANPTTSAALELNAVPCVHAVEVTALARLSGTILHIALESASAPAVNLLSRGLESVEAGATLAVDAAELRLPVASLQQAVERETVDLVASLVNAGGQSLATCRHRLAILPASHWCGTGNHPESIAAFVTPNAPALAAVLRDVSARVKESTRQGVLDGYQSGSAARVQQIAEACFQALAARNIQYVTGQASFETEGQKVRTVSEVLADGLGNCLDLSVALAALLEACGLHTMILFDRAHATVAFSTVDSHFPEATHTGLTRLVNRMELGESRVIEATALCGAEAGFGEALERGERWTRSEHSEPLLVDITSARRAGFHPIPDRLERRDSAGARAAGEAPSYAWKVVQPADLPPLSKPAVAPHLLRLETWRKRLLDLTLRNPLIHDTDSNGVPLLLEGEAALSLLEDTLWEGRTLRLLDRGAMRAMSPDAVAAEIRNGILRSTLQEAELFKRSTKVFRSGRSSFEETGARSLFVALGFLEYRVEQRPDPVRAPLILQAVTLERISRVEGFRVRSTADEPVVNIALIESLRATLGRYIGLGSGRSSELDADAKGLDLPAILNRVRDAVRDLPGTRVLAQAKLGVYSFKKLPLFEEMRERGALLSEHPIVRSLLDRQPVAALENAPLVDPAAIDRTTGFCDYTLPLPADSSQTAAVLSAAAGATFVLQGPPGTGKSQTITNLIAHGLSAGKRILFIAEKSAALGVVSDRLHKAGLSAFTLDLHADRATKTSFVSQIQTALIDLDSGTAPGRKAMVPLAREVDIHRLRLCAASDALHAADAEGFSAYAAADQALAARLRAPSKSLPQGSLDASVRADSTSADMRERLDVVAALSNAFQALPPDSAQALAWIAPGKTLSAAEADACAAMARSAADTLRATMETCGQLAHSLGVSIPGTLHWVEAAARLGSAFKTQHPAAQALLDAVFAPDYAARFGALEHAIGLFAAGAQATQSLRLRYDAAVLALPLRDLLGDLREARSRFVVFRFLTTRSVKSALARVSRQPVASDIEDLIREIEGLLQAAEAIEAGKAALATVQPFLDPRGAVDAGQVLGEIRALAAAADRLRQLFPDQTGAVRVRVSEGIGTTTLPRNAEATLAALAGTLQILRELESAAAIPEGGVFSDGDTPVETLLGRLGQFVQEQSRLPAWSSFTSLRLRARALGLDAVAGALVAGSLVPADVADAARQEILAAWLRERMRAEPALADCPSDRNEPIRRAFLDAVGSYRRNAGGAITHTVRERTRAALANRSAEMTQAVRYVNELRALSTIRRPIRRVMGDAARALAVLKPVVLASPLSAATLLPADFPEFDLVVFDEASQVPVWDAVCALSRAKAAVIVGDSKQLPPTNFFDRKESEEDAEPEDTGALEPLESILDECVASGVPQRSLLWHYRSRDERLIEFSNRRSYEGRLQTFPSAHRNHPNLGVEFRFVGGTYDRGKTSTNRAEAEAIVQELASRLKNPDASTANRSLGVVTFNMAQANLIQDLLEDAMEEDSALRERVAEVASEGDAVFIKNLENVQGDERATMLFSICYGRDAQGTLYHNLGPINLAGGERRLNVAITRAQEKVILFASIRASDLDPRKCISRGARDLRDYLAFAELGTVPTTREEAGPAREMAHAAPEQVLAAALEERGWKVDLHVGRSRDFRVCLGVAEAANPDRWVLGVELDGDYHRTAPTVVDRESVREGVLCALGWRLVRVSALDVLRDLAGTVARIEASAAASETERQQGGGAAASKKSPQSRAAR